MSQLVSTIDIRGQCEKRLKELEIILGRLGDVVPEFESGQFRNKGVKVGSFNAQAGNPGS